jgi:hypothetical protein
VFLLGQTRYVDFKIVNGGTPVTGVVKANLAIAFTRNAVACTDVLTLLELGAGRYTIRYTPSAAGHDFIEIDYAAAGFTLLSSEDIISSVTLLGGSSAISLTQNTPTANALKVTSVPDPANWTLYLYHSSDWQTGNTETYQAVASTQLEASGNWLFTPLSVTSGTYHVVIRNGAGAVQVIKAYLVL